MKKQNSLKIGLMVSKGITIYVQVTRDEYNRCYNCPSTILPEPDSAHYAHWREYCVKIPVTRFAYSPRVPAKDRWLHFAYKIIGKDFFNYLLNKYKPTI